MQKSKIMRIGHEHWVDTEAGYSRDDQNALIDSLLSLEFERQ
jgi:hypothetical protein